MRSWTSRSARSSACRTPTGSSGGSPWPSRIGNGRSGWAGADSPWRTSNTVVAPGGAAKRCWRKPSGGVVVTGRDYGPTPMENTFVARPDRGRVVTIARARRPRRRAARLDGAARRDRALPPGRRRPRRGDARRSTAGSGCCAGWRCASIARRAFVPSSRCSTWCSGVGARWAERRTDLVFGEATCVQAAATLGARRPATRRARARCRPASTPLWGVSAHGRQGPRQPAPRRAAGRRRGPSAGRCARPTSTCSTT